MIRVFCLIALLGVTACGRDGAPLEPEAAIKIGIGSSGLKAGGVIGVNRGPLSVGVGIF